MKIFIVIFTTCLLCSACGVKKAPEYKSQGKFENNIYLV